MPDLKRAAHLRVPPDFFELRLDALVRQKEQLQHAIHSLGAPFIITARHPREGGRHPLPAARRRALLLEFLPHAAYVDVELRSARELKSVLGLSRRRILSFHQMDARFVDPQRLLDQAFALRADIFKLVLRTDTSAQLEALLQFFEQNKSLPICALGLGRLGAEARRQLLRAGSVATYAHLGTPLVAGQLSLRQMRRLAKSLRIT